MFHAGTLGYFAQYGALSQAVALSQRGSHRLSMGYGSYGYEPKVDSFFGIARSIEPGGVVMNVRVGRYVASHANDAQQTRQLNLQTGMLSSALEHAVPEQMYVTENDPGEAVSALKALAKANANNQRIYHITPENQATTLPHIHHDAQTMSEIQSALAVGREVITHTDAISVPGWSGAGYLILDPRTGDGAYKITGGVNGGVMYLAGHMAALSIIALVVFHGIAAVGIAVALSAVMVFALSFAIAAIQVWKVSFEDAINPFVCGFSGAFSDFSAADALAGTNAFYGKARLVKIITAVLAAYGITSRIGLAPCI